jgi:hypothetical protein
MPAIRHASRRNRLIARAAVLLVAGACLPVAGNVPEARAGQDAAKYEKVIRAIEEKRLSRMAEFLKRQHPSESIERGEIDNWAWNHLLVGDYKSLELMARTYRDGRQRTQSGLWKLSLFYAAFDPSKAFPSSDNMRWQQLLKVTVDWRREFPDSPTPFIVAAILLEQRAWGYHRNGVASDSGELARKNLELARRILVENEAIVSGDPQYFAELAAIALLQHAEPEEFMELIERGLAVEPEYYPLYFVAVEYFSPKWYGDAAQIEALANTAVAQTREVEGTGMYARIYWYASQSIYGWNLFSESNVDWERMSDGIDDVLSRFPDSWNINHFALFSCLAGDAGKTRQLMGLIGDSTVMEAWGGGTMYRDCAASSKRNATPNKKAFLRAPG